jgi:drug/metabolite transporter (DMT)-like permease
MTSTQSHEAPSRAGIIAAFAAIYLIWGSTYLGIRFAIETIPPFFMAAIRFVVAGTVIFVWLRLRSVPLPKAIHWRSGLILGLLLLVGGNGGVTWAEQIVPSGIAALLIAMLPVWMVLVDWLRPGGVRPMGPVVIGLLLGLSGMILLVGPGNLAGNNQINPLGALALVVASLSWSIGSVYSRHAEQPDSPLMATAVEMLCGGLLLFVVAIASGEGAKIDLAHISQRSLLALLYLTVFGSIIAFSCYVWLLKVTSPARASTYAYVNPVVAVLLGWAIANEPLTLRILLAAGIIIAAVVVITTYRARAATEAAGEPGGAPVGEADKLIEESA